MFGFSFSSEQKITAFYLGNFKVKTVIFIILFGPVGHSFTFAMRPQVATHQLMGYGD